MADGPYPLATGIKKEEKEEDVYVELLFPDIDKEVLPSGQPQADLEVNTKHS